MGYAGMAGFLLEEFSQDGLASLLFSFPLLAQEGHKHTELLEEIGKVSFPITCEQSVQKEFDRGLALLHSFW